MTTTTTGTSLMLIALGAVLAFAVSFQVVGIDIVTIGAILMIVGFIGLTISILTLAGYAPWNASRAGQVNQTGAVAPQVAATAPTQAGAPAAQTPTNSPQASVVVVGTPVEGSVPPSAAPVTPATPAEVAPRT